MDSAYLSAVSALGGSLVGGLISGIATWASQRAQAKAGLIAHQISLRERLYTDFIATSTKVYGNAIVSDKPQIEDLATLQAMITQMRILSSPRVVVRAEEVQRETADTYFMPNKTIKELYEAMKSGRIIDPLKAFSEAVREEGIRQYPRGYWPLP